MSTPDKSSSRERKDVGHPVLPGGLSAADHERIHALAEKGWGSSRIARAISKHPSTVRWFMYREGLKLPKPTSRPISYMRNGQPVRGFSQEEDAFLEELRLRGHGISEIARLVTEKFGHPRSVHTVHNRLVMLAGLDAEAA